MKVFRRVIVEKRAALVPIVLTIVANIGVYVFLAHPLQGRVASGETRMTAATRAQREAERSLATARATLAGKQLAEVQLQKFYHQTLPDDLAAARHAAYVRLAQLAAQANVRYDRHTAQETHLKNSDLSRLQMVVTLEGTYPDIRRLIHAIETAPEFLAIDNMALTVRNDVNAPLVLTLAISTYFWNGRDAI